MRPVSSTQFLQQCIQSDRCQKASLITALVLSLLTLYGSYLSLLSGVGIAASAILAVFSGTLALGFIFLIIRSCCSPPVSEKPIEGELVTPNLPDNITPSSSSDFTDTEVELEQPINVDWENFHSLSDKQLSKLIARGVVKWHHVISHFSPSQVASHFKWVTSQSVIWDLTGKISELSSYQIAELERSNPGFIHKYYPELTDKQFLHYPIEQITSGLVNRFLERFPELVSVNLIIPCLKRGEQINLNLLTDKQIQEIFNPDSDNNLQIDKEFLSQEFYTRLGSRGVHYLLKKTKLPLENVPIELINDLDTSLFEIGYAERIFPFDSDPRRFPKLDAKIVRRFVELGLHDPILKQCTPIHVQKLPYNTTSGQFVLILSESMDEKVKALPPKMVYHFRFRKGYTGEWEKYISKEQQEEVNSISIENRVRSSIRVPLREHRSPPTVMSNSFDSVFEQQPDRELSTSANKMGSSLDQVELTKTWSDVDRKAFRILFLIKQGEKVSFEPLPTGKDGPFLIQKFCDKFVEKQIDFLLDCTSYNLTNIHPDKISAERELTIEQANRLFDPNDGKRNHKRVPKLAIKFVKQLIEDGWESYALEHLSKQQTDALSPDELKRAMKLARI